MIFNEISEIVKGVKTKIKLLQKQNKLLYERIFLLEDHIANMDKIYKEHSHNMEQGLYQKILNLEKKLKRNYTKPERLILYRSIIEEIVKIESIGHKPNIQKICDKIRGNDIWDLRPPFDIWKRRKPELYATIKKVYECKLKSNI